MYTKEPLDYLLIPKSFGKLKNQREIRASEERKIRKIRKTIIMEGNDSEEDILNLGKILKSGDRIGFDTFPLHFKEYEDIINRAKREGKFPNGIEVEFIGTNQTLKQLIYGILGLGEERLIERKVDYQKSRRGRWYIKLKNIIKRKILNLEN